MDNQLYCGAAKADITPNENELDGLFGLMGTPYAGILDRISLRVAALECRGEKALIVAFDLDKAPEPKDWIPALSSHTGISEDRIFYFATHTHSAPLTTVRPHEKGRATETQRASMNRYEAMLKEKLFSCADSAIGCMRPARIGSAWGESYVNTNRNADFVYTDENGQRYPYVNEGMNWGAEVDHTLFTMRIEDLDGNPIVYFVNYPMHCCLVFLNNYDDSGAMGISGDIAGNISSLMEEYYPGSIAIWSSGAAGDVDPKLFNTFIYPDPKDGSCIREPIKSLEVTMQQLRMIVGWHLHDIKETVRRIENMEDSIKISSTVEWSETPRNGSDEPYRIRMQTLKLGRTVLVGIGGELYNSIGKRLREISPAENTVIVNHTASIIDDAGYILDDDALIRTARKAPIKHMVPGGGSNAVIGTVGPSLEKHLLHMLGE